MDPVAALIAYLEPLVTVPVVSTVPKQRPVSFVQIRRVGGNALAPVRDIARLDVFTWADSDSAAAALAYDVRPLVWALAGTNTLGEMVYTVEEFLGPRQADDELTGSARMWATYDLGIRAEFVTHQ